MSLDRKKVPLKRLDLSRACLQRRHAAGKCEPKGRKLRDGFVTQPRIGLHLCGRQEGAGRKERTKTERSLVLKHRQGASAGAAGNGCTCGDAQPPALSRVCSSTQRSAAPPSPGQLNPAQRSPAPPSRVQGSAAQPRSGQPAQPSPAQPSPARSRPPWPPARGGRRQGPPLPAAPGSTPAVQQVPQYKTACSAKDACRRAQTADVSQLAAAHITLPQIRAIV